MSSFVCFILKAGHHHMHVYRFGFIDFYTFYKINVINVELGSTFVHHFLSINNYFSLKAGKHHID